MDRLESRLDYPEYGVHRFSAASTTLTGSPRAASFLLVCVMIITFGSPLPDDRMGQCMVNRLLVGASVFFVFFVCFLREEIITSCTPYSEVRTPRTSPRLEA